MRTFSRKAGADQGTKLRVTLGLTCCFFLITEVIFRCIDEETSDGSERETPGDEGSTKELLGAAGMGQPAPVKERVGERRAGGQAGPQDPRKLCPGP